MDTACFTQIPFERWSKLLGASATNCLEACLCLEMVSCRRLCPVWAGITTPGPHAPIWENWAPDNHVGLTDASGHDTELSLNFNWISSSRVLSLNRLTTYDSGVYGFKIWIQVGDTMPPTREGGMPSSRTHELYAVVCPQHLKHMVLETKPLEVSVAPLTSSPMTHQGNLSSLPHQGDNKDHTELPIWKLLPSNFRLPVPRKHPNHHFSRHLSKRLTLIILLQNGMNVFLLRESTGVSHCFHDQF